VGTLYNVQLYERICNERQNHIGETVTKYSLIFARISMSIIKINAYIYESKIMKKYHLYQPTDEVHNNTSLTRRTKSNVS
jgi:hypothetical protein